MDQKTFIKTLRSWQNGSISRREFLGRTGLGIAAAVVATNMPGLLTSTAHAAEQAKLGDRLSLATWPNYHSQDNLDAFGKTTGARGIIDCVAFDIFHRAALTCRLSHLRDEPLAWHRWQSPAPDRKPEHD